MKRTSLVGLSCLCLLVCLQGANSEVCIFSNPKKIEQVEDCTMLDEIAVAADSLAEGVDPDPEKSETETDAQFATRKAGNLQLLSASSGDLIVLTAAPGKRHFSLTSGPYTLTIKWLTLKGGNPANGFGGSIFVYNVAATLKVSTCIFLQNSASTGGGVFAYNHEPVLAFDNVRFQGNTATWKAGGAVYVYKGSFNGEANTFTGNTYAYYGGVVYVVAGSMENKDSTFTSNVVAENDWKFPMWENALDDNRKIPPFF